MQKFTIIVFFFLAFSAQSVAQQMPFQMIDSNLRTISEMELVKLDSQSDKGVVLDSERSLYFSQSNIKIVVRTGPADDMLSYRIQGLRNPTLGIQPGATIHLLFVNMDDDMHHDIRLGGALRKFSTSPGTIGTVGASHLAPNENEKYYAEELTLHAVDSGSFVYYCSVKGHATGGMWGNIVIGSNPNALTRVTRPSCQC
jgi:rusticyanin